MPRRFPRFALWFPAASALVFGAALLSAHGTAPNGDLRGTVEGAFPRELRVALEGGGAVAGTRPDADGRSAFKDLAVGSYRLRVEGAHIEPLRRSVILDGGDVDLGRLATRPTTAALAAALFAHGLAHPERTAAALAPVAGRLEAAHPGLRACMRRVARAGEAGPGAAGAPERARAVGFERGLPPRVVDGFIHDLDAAAGLLRPAEDFAEFARAVAALKAGDPDAPEASAPPRPSHVLDSLLRKYETLLPMYGLRADAEPLRDVGFAYAFATVHPRAAALCS